MLYLNSGEAKKLTPNEIYALHGRGTIFTIVASGDSTSTVLKGSLDSVNWVDIVSFDVETAPSSAVLQFGFLYLKHEGTSDLHIAWGE